jgi:hypothetical protein
VPDQITVSDDAMALLRRRLTGERVAVTEETRRAYRELVDAGLMMPLHTMTGGDEGAYRLTELAVTYNASRPASFAASPSPTH